TTFALNLVGSASLKESYTFTPDVDVSMTSEFGDTVTGKLGDKFAFDGTKAGEGEGRFNVMATYQLHGVVRAELAISLALGFEYTFLSIAGFAEAHASFLGAGVIYRYESPTYTLLQGTIGDVSIDIPFYTETDRYDFGTAMQEFSVAYENFRTVRGSGD